jgi:hypothetical protein
MYTFNDYRLKLEGLIKAEAEAFHVNPVLNMEAYAKRLGKIEAYKEVLALLDKTLKRDW